MTNAVTPADRAWMQRAVDLSALCPPVAHAYSVGAVIVSADGRELANGYSRETDPHIHAEESALAKLEGTPDHHKLKDATLYSTLEPCSQRRSRPKPCAELILTSGLRRVVIAWREPSLFVGDCIGVEMLEAAGVTVREIADLAPAARAANKHLPGFGADMPDTPA